MSDKKNEDYTIRMPESGARSPFGGERDSFLPPRPSRPAQQQLYSPLAKIENNPAVSILAYCLSSISMTVVNKYVVSGPEWNLNFFYLAVQAIVCILAIEICKQLGLITNLAPLEINKAKRWFPISLLLVGMIYTSTKSLQYLSVPVYTIFKNLTIIVIAYGEVLWFGGSVTPLALLSFGLMVLSSVVAAWADTRSASQSVKAAEALATLNAGYAWMGMNVFCTASYLLSMRKVIKNMNFKDWDTMFYNNFLTIPVLILCSLLGEDWSSANLVKNFPPESRSSLFVGMIYSGIATIFISYCSAWCIRITSSTTYSMVGALNKLPIAISGLVFFAAPVTVGSVSAILIGFVSGIVYAWAKVRQTQVAKNTLPTTQPTILIFSLLLSYPLAGLLKRVPDSRPEFKNLFIISCGLFYLVGLFSLWAGVRTILIASGGTYALTYYLRTSPYMPWIVFFFLMDHMATNQLSRQFADNAAAVDITGAQMVLVMKLSAFAWNVADGTLPEDQLTDIQKDRRIVKLPSLSDYAAYVLFFPSLMVGPAFDYNEYRGWIDCTMFDVPATVDPAKKPPTRKKRRIPRSGTPAMWKLASGVLWVLLFLNFSKWYSPDVLLSDRYMTFGFLRRVFTMHMVGVTTRMKYYGVWFMAEGSCILAGLGYNGVDPVTGKVSWNRLQNINPWGVEAAQNSRAYLENWNMNTNKWLRYYIYLRVTPRNRKPGFRASLATFVTSAFWHGFYPGYYLTFVLASFIQTAAKHFRRNVRPFFLDPATQKPLPSKKYYDAASWLATQATFSFAAMPFVILRFDDSLEVWRRVYFYAIVTTAASLAFFASPAKAHLRTRLEQRRAPTAAAGLSRTASSDSISGRPRQEPVLGLSSDPGRDIDEAFQEIREEVERAQAKMRAAELDGKKKDA
ncbi:MBOAT-domain-containing protein [Xylariaceae sp. FL0662B]|nr:MBOAT-domain-containing protein [Xylariaceae sp. FL0662B]